MSQAHEKPEQAKLLQRKKIQIAERSISQPLKNVTQSKIIPKVPEIQKPILP